MIDKELGKLEKDKFWTTSLRNQKIKSAHINKRENPFGKRASWDESALEFSQNINLYPPLSISSYVRLGTRVISIVRGVKKKEKRETGAVNVSSPEHYAEETAALQGEQSEKAKGAPRRPLFDACSRISKKAFNFFVPPPSLDRRIYRGARFFISPVVK